MSNVVIPFYSSSPEKRSKYRLITQNLLASASMFEEPANPSPTVIQDLSTFIDLYCLYDRLVVMKDPSSQQLLNREGDLFKLLKRKRKVIQEELGQEVTAALLKDAERRIRVFLRGEQADEIEAWLADFLDPENVKKQVEQLAFDPESEAHFTFGTKWLKKTPPYKDLLLRLKDDHTRRSAFFVARTFFYLSYANITKYTFTPDTARSSVTKPILQREKLFVEQLLEQLKSSYKPHGIYPELESMISPLSVIVFERAASKENILLEMENLREQLESTRNALRSLEHEAFTKGEKQSRKAKKKWKSILAEVDKSFGDGGAMINYDKAADFTEATVEAVKAPISAKSWSQIIKLPIEVINRMINRGPLVEIHRLRPQLGSVERVEKAIRRLFKNKY